MRIFAAISLLLCLCATGCLALRSTPPLPVRYSEPRGPQLVINSDFKLAKHARLLEELEQLRDRISGTLDLPVSDHPIQVYLFKDGKKYRRFLKQHFPKFPKRRAFFVRSQGRLAVYAHFSDRVAEDLRHEVAHGYMHSTLPHLPMWLDEGLAEYFETPRDARGAHMQHVAELSEAAKNMNSKTRWQPDLSRLEKLDSVGDMQQLDYAESWAWVHWMLHGSDESREALHDYLRDARKRSTAPPLSKWMEKRIEMDADAMLKHLWQLEKNG